MKKAGAAFLVILFIVILTVGILIGLSSIRVDSSKYSETEHIERISKRVKKRYMKKDYGFTDFHVYPLYNENDEMEHCLIEFEPSGFFCVKINKTSSIMPYYIGMYLKDPRCTANDYLKDPWQRVRYTENVDDLALYPDSCWKAKEGRDGYAVYEVDESGEPVYHYVSPFKAANVLDEKLYCFEHSGCVFAVKRGDDFLNLVTMENFKNEDFNTAQFEIVYEPILNL